MARRCWWRCFLVLLRQESSPRTGNFVSVRTDVRPSRQPYAAQRTLLRCGQPLATVRTTRPHIGDAVSEVLEELLPACVSRVQDLRKPTDLAPANLNPNPPQPVRYPHDRRREDGSPSASCKRFRTQVAPKGAKHCGRLNPRVLGTYTTRGRLRQRQSLFAEGLPHTPTFEPMLRPNTKPLPTTTPRLPPRNRAPPLLIGNRYDDALTALREAR